jgi:hypothetical protein
MRTGQRLLLTICVQRLAKQLEDLEVPFTENFIAALGSADHVVDAIFGLDTFWERRLWMSWLTANCRL